MSVMRIESSPHPHDLSDSDLALVAALQDAPRASWASIGRAVGVSAPTARRRWAAIVESGAAWATTYVGSGAGMLFGLTEVRCRPGSVDAVAAVLRMHPKVISVTGMTGDRDLVLTILAEDMARFRRLIQSWLGSHEAVIGVRSTVVTRMFSEGSRWRAVGPPQAVALPSVPDGEPIAPTAQWHAVLDELERDGRASPQAIAARLGSSEAHARRVVRRLLGTGWIQQRIDVSLEQRMWPHALALWLVVPAARLEATALQIANMPMTRMCAALAGGASNLYVIVWLRDLSDAASLEAELARSLELRVLDRAILLHYYKRVGHLFDDEDRREGHVSWLAPAPEHARTAGAGP
ncbi:MULTISPECIES: Lrp/AsnC family transcriptional regulator [Microbacterium]|uniref:Lrp/AsnC ligand binding domain-containing protein n=1 Tax=Microbacterium algihabitans TaxID=3075992 RepID=A0ABU3RSB2_9MICO|nr:MULTISPECIES: Lrp/AsnC ligand binding domain-containing protein [Microbacterium]MDU0325713.1 Lrp/AsnC ligand binding domain-containing protein [Microbacterium sp. KSW2-21]